MTEADESLPGMLQSAATASEEPPVLEAWYRDELPKAKYDISSSGVQPYTFAQLRQIVGLSSDELEGIVLQDSVSLGALPLREAIAERYAAGRADQVLATHGSSEAIALILPALLRPGTRVVMPDPVYHALRTYAELRGCQIVSVCFEDDDDDPNDPDPGGDDALLPALLTAITPGTAAVIVNFPHNPTGAELTSAGLARLVERCEQVGATLVWDGAMEELTMRALPSVLEPRVTPSVVRFGTLSKAFGLPGLRVGWCIAHPELIYRTLAVRDRTTLFLSPLVEFLATRAIRCADALVRPRLAQAQKNLQQLKTWVLAHAAYVRWTPPDGGVCGLLHIRGVGDTTAFCRRLLSETGVLLVPGRAFNRRTCVRIGYGGSGDELREGLRRLSEFLRRSSL